MTSILPPIPKFIFTVFEPLSLIAGFAGAIADPEWFVAEQIAFSPPQKFSKNTIVVALQLGNEYLLMAIIGLAVFYTTTEPKVVRNYVIALLLGDVGHLAVTFYILEYKGFLDVSKWNAVAWGNIAFTLFLLLSRTAYLTGLFGPDQKPAIVSTDKKVR